MFGYSSSFQIGMFCDSLPVLAACRLCRRSITGLVLRMAVCQCLVTWYVYWRLSCAGDMSITLPVS